MSWRNRGAWEDSSLYYQYIKDINRYPLITKKEEIRLLQLVKDGNQRAIDKLVCANLKFVINVAFMYKGQGFTLPELISEGNIGLIEAAKRFDVNQKIRFISYAVWWIRQSITRAIAEKARIVRISAEKELVLRRINKHQAKLRQTIGGGLRIDASDLGKKMGYTTPQMEKILEMGQYHASLNEPLDGESDTKLMDMVRDTNVAESDELAVQVSRNDYLKKSLMKLHPQEAKILQMYFGIDYHKAMSLEDIGEIIGLSKERVRQIKEKGLENLRKSELPRELLLAA